jgi:hypothetical protein
MISAVLFTALAVNKGLKQIHLTKCGVSALRTNHVELWHNADELKRFVCLGI